MSHPLLDRHAHVALLVRSRSLRLRGDGGRGVTGALLRELGLHWSAAD